MNMESIRVWAQALMANLSSMPIGTVAYPRRDELNDSDAIFCKVLVCNRNVPVQVHISNNGCVEGANCPDLRKY